MRLVMTLKVRDEADIISDNLRFHRAMGVDFFVVTPKSAVTIHCLPARQIHIPASIRGYLRLSLSRTSTVSFSGRIVRGHLFR